MSSSNGDEESALGAGASCDTFMGRPGDPDEAVDGDAGKLLDMENESGSRVDESV
jgi:hypothetical protein